MTLSIEASKVIIVNLYRLIRNPIGSSHPEATLKAYKEHGAPEDAIQVENPALPERCGMA